MRVRVSQGTFKGGAYLYVDTGSTYTFAGTYFLLPAGSDWTELTLDLRAPMTTYPSYDPSRVVIFGLQLATGSVAAGSGPVTFNIDSFWIGPPAPDAGG